MIAPNSSETWKYCRSLQNGAQKKRRCRGEMAPKAVKKINGQIWMRKMKKHKIKRNKMWTAESATNKWVNGTIIGGVIVVMDSVRAAALCLLSITFMAAPERTREPSARAPTVKEYIKVNDITSLVWFLTSTKLLTSFSLLYSFPEVPCYHASAAATDGSKQAPFWN